MNVLPNSSINVIISPNIIENKENNIVIYPNLVFNIFYIDVTEYNTIKFIDDCGKGIKKIKTGDYSINVYSKLSSDILKCKLSVILVPGNRIMFLCLVNIKYYMCLIMALSVFYFFFILN